MWNNLHSLYLASGDLQYFWREEIRSFSWWPEVFHPELGFGKTLLASLWLGYPFQIVIKALSTIGFKWFAIEKILWAITVILPFFAAYRLATYLFGKSRIRALSAVIYATNTYFLLILGGGQLGVALAFGLAPLVLLKFIEQTDHRFQLKSTIVSGLLTALLIAFDLRIAYLVIGAVVLYVGLKMIDEGSKKRSAMYHVSCIMCHLIVPLIIAGTVHLYWILPTVLAGGGTADLGKQFTDPSMLQFLSFADFSHALSLLHPNWPENLFGRVHFLQPEFLVIPILAFASFMMNDQRLKIKEHNSFIIHHSSFIRYFVFLSLLGVFFAKGVNPPLGGIFSWMFVHVPGFIMFRDPTKFYLYIAIGYSILIPLTLYLIQKRMNDFRLKMNDKVNFRKSFIIYHLSFIIFFVFWLFTIRALFAGEVQGNFKPVVISQDYVHLKELLVNDKTPYRTLWLPTSENFAYSSEIHPMLTGEELFQNASQSGIMKIIKTPDFGHALSGAGVKYVIVPIDLSRHIFLADYQFAPKVREDLVATLSSVLVRKADFPDAAVYVNPDYTMHIDVPPEIPRQEYLAKIGTVVSVITLVGWVTALIVL